MSTPYPFRPCLWCEDSEKPRTDEHVLQEAFGTSLVLDDDVCGDCNTRVFSPLDTKLVDVVRRLGYWDHPDLPVKRTMLDGQLGVAFDAEQQLWQSVTLTKDMVPILLPQFIVRYDGAGVFVTDKRFAKGDILATIAAELARPAEIVFDEQIIAGKEPRMHTALVRSAPKKYLVRASDRERATAMKQAVLNGEFGGIKPDGPGQEGTTKPPNVQMQLVIPFGDVERALAKTAVNFLCATLGPEVARSAELAGLRDFALRSYDGKRAGYVSLLFRDPDPRLAAFCEPFALEGHHTLLLAPTRGGLHLAVILYQRPFAVVRIAPEAIGARRVELESVAAITFDYRAKTHTIHRMPEALKWFYERARRVKAPPVE